MTEQLKSYDVTAWKDFTSYAVITIQAASPAAAIEAARQGWEDGDVDWEACNDGGNPVHFAKAEPNTDAANAGDPDEPKENAEWTDPNFMNERCAQAARAMLTALEEARDAIQSVHDSWERGDLAGAVNCLPDLDAIIAQARAAGLEPQS